MDGSGDRSGVFRRRLESYFSDGGRRKEDHDTSVELEVEATPRVGSNTRVFVCWTL